MAKLITIDDLRDTFFKGKQRGWDFILSKFTFSNTSRTKSAFNESSNRSSNWWEISYVKKRWNYLITGNENISYEHYLMTDILKDEKKIKLLSLGSGTCSNEMKLAAYDNFESITCIDLSEVRLSEAKKIAQQKDINNMIFICSDIDTYDFPENYFDIVFFNASLHHFKDVQSLLTGEIMSCLKKSGKLVINEFVGPNRLQFPNHQIEKINEAINIIPKKYRRRYKSKSYKNNFFGSGIIRMIISDPSECVDSINIMPSIHKHYKTIVEKPYGGNILMNALKDISYHFADDMDDEKQNVLDELFLFEDNYLKHNSSDFIFGVYEK